MMRYRVLVVDDSAFMRKIISDILSTSDKLEVIGTARDGLDCLNKVKELHPDVVTLDIEMPRMDGLECLEQLMKSQPLPVIMLSSLTNEGARATISALEKGAFDFLPKPSGSISLDLHKIGDELIEKVTAAAQLKNRFRAKIHPYFQADEKISIIKKEVEASIKSYDKMNYVVAIGTSTGGPKALQSVLTKIPAGFSEAIVIVQHMPPKFTRSLAQRLDSLSQITVLEAEDGQKLLPGTAYIAPGGYHMEVKQRDKDLFISLNTEPPVGGHRPSVNVLFSSVAELKGIKKLAIIMTGMGNDGTEGLKKLKESDQVKTIVEDEQSCVVFGMPRSAIQAGCADTIVPLEGIAQALIESVES
ncbi:chemotaxis response regulator protein-glutamate methylesterase [Microaerobacter geothermalis]|uniref:protein-glutamate methylesterase/protein-glutamine glutaminase n=1 Tax=Microaerobacter geothermalis TaxID=674972 RepID=UPI001F3A6323|nr:chemotaxis response regulator protein-glutamate methylesterase [Microaerobacter geothermalis]MCF6093817.1 chemotaxis response regulator protein-glutamate methylesterase [Microaerobacter geothermalis]